MTKTYYHATTHEAAESIFKDDYIKPGVDHCIYLCTDPKDACKFLMVRGHKRMVVFELVLEESLVEESFDHSEAFFKCKAYLTWDKIFMNQCTGINLYECSAPEDRPIQCGGACPLLCKIS